MKSQTWLTLSSLSILLSLSSVGCGSPDDGLGSVGSTTQDSHCGGSDSADACGRPVRVAWFGNTPDNTYDNADLNGATQRAQKMHSTVEPFYCGYDPTVQLNQCLDAVKSGRFDAFLIDANDGVGITPCVTSAAQHGIAVVAVDLPIGADPAAVGPQVPGQAGAVLTPAAKFGGTLAPTVAALCDKIGKCNVVYLAGSFVINYDIIAMNDLNALPSTHPNIKLVAEEEALYDQGTARTIMQNLLAQSTDIQLVVAGGDQMARGAEEAIAAAGPLPNPIAIIGGGAGAYAVDAIRAGRWYGTFVTLPFDEGDLGAKMVIRAARYQHLTATGIDPVVSRGFPAFLTADNLADFKGFVPEWPG